MPEQASAQLRRIILMLPIICIVAARSSAQNARDLMPAPVHAGASLAQRTAVDVGILVMPIDATSAHVGIAYRGRVPHREVRAEIARLERAGWRIDGNVNITDETIHPLDVRRFPRTTGAELTLANAAQFTPAGPALKPYLVAFQRWNHVEVMFGLPRSSAAGQGTHFDSRALTVDMVPEEGIYRFEAAIHDHLSDLPDPTLSAAQPAPRAQVAAPMRVTQANTGLWPALLAVSGIGLVVCGSLLLLLRKHTVIADPSVPARQANRVR